MGQLNFFCNQNLEKYKKKKKIQPAKLKTWKGSLGKNKGIKKKKKKHK